MGKPRPQVELELLVDLVQAAAEIAGVLADCEGVRVRRDPDAAEKALNVAGQAATARRLLHRFSQAPCAS